MIIINRILRRIDFLAPSVSLYYKGSSTHYSRVSEIASLIATIIYISSIVYYIRPLILKNDPTIKMIEELKIDAGNLILNPSNLVHSINIMNYNELFSYPEFDFTSFRVIGVETELFLSSGNLNNLDHWVYGPCDVKSDFTALNSEYNEMDDLTNNYLNSSICIKQYYNSKEKKYYDRNNGKFIWPTLRHGILNADNNIYTIIIEKCSQDTLELIAGKGYYCKNESEISQIIQDGWFITLNILDNFIDIKDYKEPIKKYLTTYEYDLYNNYYYEAQLSFSSNKVKNQEGVIIKRSKTTNTYDIDDVKSVLHPLNKKGTIVYASFQLQLNNLGKTFERKYTNLLDVFARIGGFSKIVKTIAKLLVKYYNQYRVLLDTKLLISSLYLDENEKEKNTREKKEIKLKKNNSINNLDNDTTISQLNKESNNNSVIDINNNKTNNDIKNDNFIDNNININQNIQNYIDKNKYPLDNEKKANEILNNNNLEKNEKSEGSEEKSEKSLFVEKNKYFSYCSYVCHKLSCKKKYQHYKIYDKFRTKILSEEQIIKNHIIIYNLSKVNNDLANQNISSLKEIINELENNSII